MSSGSSCGYMARASRNLLIDQNPLAVYQNPISLFALHKNRHSKISKKERRNFNQFTNPRGQDENNSHGVLINSSFPFAFGEISRPSHQWSIL